MKKLAAVIILISVLLCSLLVKAEIVDGIIAIVNSEVITQADLNAILVPIYAQYKSTYSDEELLKKLDEAKNNILYQLIEDKLILQEARKYGITATDEEVDERLEQIKSQFSDEQEFRAALNSQNLNLNDLKEKYKEQIMIKKIINLEVRSKVYVSPTEVALFYEKNKDDFELPERVEVKTIMIRKEDESPKAVNEALKKIKMIEAKLKEGEDFAKLAREYSHDPSAVDGGDMGYIPKGQMMNKIDEVIFNTPLGATTEIIETPIGYHIFKIVDIQDVSIEDFDEARIQIENYLFQEKAKERFDEWMEGLKDNAYISIK
jgi:parvulin-like peptidyl-prolyl isomerase